MKKLIFISSLLAAAACGGAPKGSVYGSGGKNAPPPPPSIAQGNDVAQYLERLHHVGALEPVDALARRDVLDDLQPLGAVGLP